MGLAPRPIGVLGGTFDPIHYGHLRPALELLETLKLAEVRFIPCRIPAHRAAPLIAAKQRFDLVQLAMAEQSGFVADDRELRREGSSYMVDTLASLRADCGDDTPLCLILGDDAFQELPTWHHWQDLSNFVHIVVMQRPGILQLFPPALEAFMTSRRVYDALALSRKSSGSVLFQPVTQLHISATQIRTLLASGQSPRYLLPETVLASIRDQALYLGATR